MANAEGYWLMDGRAIDDIDRALVLEVCETLDEAEENLFDYGADTCIIDCDTMKVIDSILWRH